MLWLDWPLQESSSLLSIWFARWEGTSDFIKAPYSSENKLEKSGLITVYAFFVFLRICSKPSWSFQSKSGLMELQAQHRELQFGKRSTYYKRVQWKVYDFALAMYPLISDFCSDNWMDLQPVRCQQLMVYPLISINSTWDPLLFRNEINIISKVRCWGHHNPRWMIISNIDLFGYWA